MDTALVFALLIAALNDQHRDDLSEKGLQLCQRWLALIGGHSWIWNLHFLCHFMLLLSDLVETLSETSRTPSCPRRENLA